MNIIACTNRPWGANSPYFLDNVILLDGIVEIGDFDKFQEVVNKFQYGSKVTVFINSAGGNVQEAIKIGESINSYGFNTLFSSEKYEIYEENSGREINYGVIDSSELIEIFGYNLIQSLPSPMNICMSAANFIFMGGKKRKIEKYNPYSWGSHQFSSSELIDISSFQYYLYDIILYLQKMGVSLNFIKYLLKGNSINNLTIEELINLNIINVNKDLYFNIVENLLTGKIENHFTEIDLNISKKIIKDKKYIVLSFLYKQNDDVNIDDLYLNLGDEDHKLYFMKDQYYNILHCPIEEKCFTAEILKNRETIFNLLGFPHSMAYCEHEFILKYDFYQTLKLIEYEKNDFFIDFIKD